MKALVIAPFKDAPAGKVRKQGQIIDVSQERYAKINGAALGPFLRALEDKPVKTKTTKKSTKK